MRITGGKWKGQRPKVAKGFKGRPTTDFGREGLFNLLNARVNLAGLHVLELFGGTGMVALEFLSRDCGSVTSVENDPTAVRGMSKLARDWDVDDWSVVRGNALQFIERSLTQYDLIFADPPYDLPDLPELPGQVLGGSLLVPGGWFILEHGERTDVSGCTHYVETRKYGHVHFSLFTT
jgi:16S rRNA (guanine(966)-N(2))-methyltransferase RsmD